MRVRAENRVGQAPSPCGVQRRANLPKHDDVKADAVCLDECALFVTSEVLVVLGKPEGEEGELGRKCRSWVLGESC